MGRALKDLSLFPSATRELAATAQKKHGAEDAEQQGGGGLGDGCELGGDRRIADVEGRCQVGSRRSDSLITRSNAGLRTSIVIIYQAETLSQGRLRCRDCRAGNRGMR